MYYLSKLNTSGTNFFSQKDVFYLDRLHFQRFHTMVGKFVFGLQRFPVYTGFSLVNQMYSSLWPGYHNCFRRGTSYIHIHIPRYGITVNHSYRYKVLTNI